MYMRTSSNSKGAWDVNPFHRQNFDKMNLTHVNNSPELQLNFDTDICHWY